MESTGDTTKTMKMSVYFCTSFLLMVSLVSKLCTSRRSLIVFPTNYCNINKTILAFITPPLLMCDYKHTVCSENPSKE